MKTPNQIRREARSSQDLLDRLNNAMFSSSEVVRLNPFILRELPTNQFVLQDVPKEFNPFAVEPKGADPTVEDVLSDEEREQILTQVEELSDRLLPIIEKALIQEVALSICLNQVQARFASMFEGKTSFGKAHSAIQSGTEMQVVSSVMQELNVGADVAARVLSNLQPTVNINELLNGWSNEKLRRMQTVPKVQR